MPTFGERLRQLRREAGLSQSELAGSDLSASYVSLLEAGKRSPSDEALQFLCARLNCSRTQLMEGRPSDRDQRLKLEVVYAKLAVEHGESADAHDRLVQLLAEDGLPRAIRDEATLLLGTALQRLGHNQEAVPVLLPLLERANSGDAHASVVDVGQILCRAYLEVGDSNRAARTGESALEAARTQRLDTTNDYFRLAATVMAAHLRLGDIVHARAWAQSLIEQAEQAGQVGGQAALYWNSAIAADLEGRLDEALRLSEKALARLSELDNLRDYARIRLSTAQCLLAFGDPDVDRAKHLLSSCLPDLQDHGSRVDHSAWNRAMAVVLLHQGDLSGAQGRAQQALDLVDGTAAEKQALARMSLHDALRAQRRDEEASPYLQAAAQALGALPSSRPSALLWRELAERFVDAGDLPSAVDAYRHALDATGVLDHGAGSRAAAARWREIRQLAGSLGEDRA